jgi:hypothetical protein
LSTTESEYVAATYATKEALWLRSLIFEVFGKTLPPTTLFSDNQSAIALAKEHQYHARTKHIDIRFHFIRWIIEEGKSSLFTAPLKKWWPTSLRKLFPPRKSNISPTLWDSYRFEGECWNRYRQICFRIPDHFLYARISLGPVFSFC